MIHSRLLSTLLCSLLYVLLGALQAGAAPASPLRSRDAAPTALSTSAVQQYLPYIYLAGAGYCHFQGQWNCGQFCNGVPDFQLSASGGDGQTNPLWYVGYSPSLASVVVGHQGTNLTNVLAIFNDLNIIPSSLPSNLFPGVSSSATVHSGFLSSMEKSATSIQTAVTALVSSKGATKVTVVGHSLGGSTATLSAIYLKLNLPSTVSVKVVGLAVPRVGNAAFATLTDNTISDFHHINNKKDPVPTLPPRFLGYAHPNGEIHIEEDDTWYSCPGHDNTSVNCTIAADSNLFEVDFDNHGGPYLGISMGGQNCQ